MLKNNFRVEKYKKIVSNIRICLLIMARPARLGRALQDSKSCVLPVGRQAN